jgi:hypothetical protein
MTNAQIIFNESIALMRDGKIGTTGRMLAFKDEDGEIHEEPEPVAIHTYAAWKSLGYQVKKGEKAVAKFLIWKHTVKKAKADDDDDQEKMFMTKAAFFAPDQVEKA